MKLIGEAGDTFPPGQYLEPRFWNSFFSVESTRDLPEDGTGGGGIGVEGCGLRIKAHDPAMGVGSFDGNSKVHAGEDVGGCRTSAKVGGAAGAHSSVRSLGSPKAELENGIPVGGITKARGIGGDESLEIDDVEQGGFDQLALNERSTDTDDGLVGEGEFSFRECIDLELPIQVSEVIEIAFTEERFY